jgi:hypothetical protein
MAERLLKYNMLPVAIKNKITRNPSSKKVELLRENISCILCEFPCK